MVIVYSSISCALACGGNETRETWRCRLSADARKGWFPTDNEDASPNKVNSFRPRYSKLLAANLSNMLKPVTDMEEINECTYQASRGDWRERASKEQSGYLGEPPHSGLSEVDDSYGRQGNHNLFSPWRGKSEWPIVMMTQGNACRVKRLHRYRVCRTERSSA